MPIMKSPINSYIVPLLLSFVLIVSSCSDSEEPALSPIIGTWNFDSFDFDISVNGQPLEQFLVFLGASPQEVQFLVNEIRNDIRENSEFDGTVFVFRADGTFEVSVNGTLEDSGTFELLNGNTLLRMTSDGATQDFRVLELNNRRLTILSEVEESGDFFDIGLPVLLRLQLELRLVR